MTKEDVLEIMFKFNGTYISTLAALIAAKNSIEVAHTLAVLATNYIENLNKEDLPIGEIKNGEVFYTSRSGNEYTFAIEGQFATVRVNQSRDYFTFEKLFEEKHKNLLEKRYKLNYFGFPTHESIEAVWRASRKEPAEKREGGERMKVKRGSQKVN